MAIIIIIFFGCLKKLLILKFMESTKQKGKFKINGSHNSALNSLDRMRKIFKE